MLPLRMKLSIVILFLVIGICQSENDVQAGEKRKQKVFSLFTVVTFPNDQCTAKSDNTMYGTCYSESECAGLSGKVDGNCAAGFGVCCTFSLSDCSSTISQNCTYISNPSYPTTYATTGACAYSVTPINTDICQLRLDFDNFDITETAVGVCTDSLTISGPTGRNPMDLCGTLTGMHVYVEQGRSSTATTLTFTIATGGTWKIKVAQIECSSTSRAYTDCNQFITGLSGTIQSYNFPNVLLQSKEFNTCIRREAGYCGIHYSSYSGTPPDAFLLDDAAAITSINGQGAIGALAGAAVSWLDISGPRQTSQYSGGIFCEGLAATCGVAGTVAQQGHQYVVTHHTTTTANAGETGYKLAFLQVPCNSNHDNE